MIYIMPLFHLHKVTLRTYTPNVPPKKRVFLHTQVSCQVDPNARLHSDARNSTAFSLKKSQSSRSCNLG